MDCPHLDEILGTHTTPEGEVVQAGVDVDGLAVLWAKHPDDAAWEPGTSYDRPEYAVAALEAIKSGVDTVEAHFGRRN